MEDNDDVSCWGNWNEIIRIYLLPVIVFIISVIFFLPIFDKWLFNEIPSTGMIIIFKSLILTLIIYILNLAQFGYWDSDD